ncbi:hypothetical protein G6F31_017879 [Rhizopus arrhizus]|nr:hypothetical protein G6F31_017879 [Rhizopus arrhizus]
MWTTWLVKDQRFVDGRPDVLTFITEPLSAPLRIGGAPVVHLQASTSGTDSDWVVKLIDVYPDQEASTPEMGGYELPRSEAAGCQRSAAVPLRSAQRQPHLPEGAPGDGAGAVQPVPAVRPQPADLRAEHLPGQAGRLPEGDAAGLAQRRAGQLHRSAGVLRLMRCAGHAMPGGRGSAGRWPASTLMPKRVDQGRHLPKRSHGALAVVA